MIKLTPYITEKTVKLVRSNKYTLVVDYGSTKKEVESLVKKFYKVQPLQIKILKTKYLLSKKHRKSYLDRGIKKVIVELKSGQTIPGFDYEKKDEKKEKESKKRLQEKTADKKEIDGKKS